MHFNVASAREAIARLEAESADPKVWEDPTASRSVMQQIKQLQSKVAAYDRLCAQYEDAVTLAALGIEEDDASVTQESQTLADAFIQSYERLRVENLFSGEYDGLNAIVTLHSGAGGTESCDWVAMLLRMYARWAEKQGFAFEILDSLDGEEAGIKSVTFQINGNNAFGYMKCEKGVHRLVRISPFDASGRRHTSFASCDVMPEIADDTAVEIDPADLKVDTYRASGAGGQHVNKTESAIRITHVPTGVVVSCQNERSQMQNRDRAMKMLKAKLFVLRQEQQQAHLSGIRGEVKDIAWGSQIRSYVFHPYSMVKDHRTQEETGSVQAVMDGNLTAFMNAYLMMEHRNINSHA